MELTRLRRNIRSSDNWFADLEALLDAVDVCHEDCEIIERDLSNYNSLEEDSARVTVQENAERLIKVIGSLGGLQPRAVLSWLVESWGETGLNTLEDAYLHLKHKQREQEAFKDEWAEIEDHPF